MQSSPVPRKSLVKTAEERKSAKAIDSRINYKFFSVFLFLLAEDT